MTVTAASARRTTSSQPATSNKPQAGATRGPSAVGSSPKDSIKTVLTVTDDDFKEAQRLLQAYAKGPGKHTAGGCGQKDATGAWNRGLLRIKQEHIGQGSVITVYSGHNAKSDSFRRLSLEMDASALGHHGTITLKELAASVRTHHGKGQFAHESVLKFYISDKELEAAIKSQCPGLSPAEALKKARFAVNAQWGSGHNWGGFYRDGVFAMKTATGAAVQKEATIVVGMPANQASVELDVAVPISAARKKKHPALNTKKAIFISHLEAEGKARVPLTRFKEIYDRLMLLASTDPKDKAAKAAAMKAIFGAEAKDWDGERVKKYDPEGKQKLDAHGMLSVNPFNDVYLDNENRDLAEQFVVLRSRTVAGEKNAFTQINYKPGPGVRDSKTNVARRIESEIICREEVARNPRLLLPFLKDTSEPLNPHNIGSDYIEKATGKALPAAVDGKASSEITQFSGIGSNRRFKFEFTNKKTLVAFEVSLDLCATLALDKNGLPLRVDENGRPDKAGKFFAVSCFGQLEPEANHMAGAVGGAPAKSTSAAAKPAAKTAAKGSSSAAAPAASGTGGATIHIHGLKDLNSSVFKTDPGYVQFDRVMPSFQEWVFAGDIGAKDGAHSTEQKNAMGQRFAGTIEMTADEKQLYAQELAATAQFRTKAVSKLDAAVKKAEAQISQAQKNFGRLANGGPQLELAAAEAREAVWATFGELNPLDFVDLKKLPKL